MFRPISLYIGLRYTRAKRRNHFISFISLVSMLGIALGVAVLITVLSVMNGFDYQIQNKIFAMAQQVTVSNYNGPLSNWENLEKKVAQYNDVVDVAPYVNGQGMLVNSGSAAPVLVQGVVPADETKVSQLADKMVQGSFNQLQPGQYGVVMGQKLADSLGLQVGDKVTLFTPQATITPVGELPRFRRFTVVGLFNIGGGFGSFDTGIVFINMRDAQVLYNFGSAISGLRLKVTNLYAAPAVSEALQQGFQGNYLVSNWTQEYGDFFKAIKMEKTMMFFILILIVAVAAFNLVSSLVMIVNDKRPEIAILRTLGASPRSIMAIFMVQGCTVGFIGTLLGLIGGILLALNAPNLVSGIEHVFHVQLISSSVYLVDYLPSKLEWSDVWHVSILAFGLSLIATLYPAWQAARTQPAEALRYE
jgi:lipoprotein-releasing system permease protein